MQSLRRALVKLDTAVFHVERILLLVSLGMMTLLVSLDVLQRTFSRPVGKTESFLLWLLKDPSPSQREWVVEWVGPALFWAGALLFFTIATQASRSLAAERVGQPSPGWFRSMVMGTTLWVPFFLFVKLMLWAFPSSVPGAQKFALGFMLWSGMLGASLATRSRRHIVLDAITKKVDPVARRPLSLLGGLATASFCGLLTWLGTLQLMDQVSDWASGEGVGVYDALPIPMWLSTLAVPVTFGVMSLRFLAHGISDFAFGPPKGGVDSHGIDLEVLAQQDPEAAAAQAKVA